MDDCDQQGGLTVENSVPLVSDPDGSETVLRSSRGDEDDAFVASLMKECPTKIAFIIRNYMITYAIAQKFVVDATGINQSHLSQHLNRGLSMKESRRDSLYRWFIGSVRGHQPDLLRGDAGDIGGILTSPYASTPVAGPAGSKRLGRAAGSRFRWAPEATRLLVSCYDRNPTPSRPERHQLAEQCRGLDKANCAEINESRVANWFSNRRRVDVQRFQRANRNLETQKSDADSTTSGESAASPNSTRAAAATGSAEKLPPTVRLPPVSSFRRSRPQPAADRNFPSTTTATTIDSQQPPPFPSGFGSVGVASPDSCDVTTTSYSMDLSAAVDPAVSPDRRRLTPAMNSATTTSYVSSSPLQSNGSAFYTAYPSPPYQPQGWIDRPSYHHSQQAPYAQAPPPVPMVTSPWGWESVDCYQTNNLAARYNQYMQPAGYYHL